MQRKASSTSGGRRGGARRAFGAGRVRLPVAALAAAALALLAACETREEILVGKREGIREGLSGHSGEEALASSVAPQSAPALALPPQRANSAWSQSPATPASRAAHPALGADLRLAWDVRIGRGDSQRYRITADPVAADGRVYTLDASALVSAVSAQGEIVWRRDLTPINEASRDASGGGLAYGGGKLFVSSGFGLMTALDGKTGEIVWQQELGTASTGSPTVYGDLVYVVSGEALAWALDVDSGRVVWQVSATSDKTNVLGTPAAAVSEKYVVFAFGSGELQGVFRRGGLRRWDSQVAGQRQGYSGSRLVDIASDPVIAGDRVFVASHAGRTASLGVGNGRRIWTAPEGAQSSIWPAGDSIFLVSDRGQLLRLSARDGRRLWARDLPFFTVTQPRVQNEIFAHHGPIIAGGRLIVASGSGEMRFFDPNDGSDLGSVPIPGGATTNPIVADRTLYVVSSKGKLLAYR